MAGATSIWGQLKIASAAGILFGGYPFARNFYFVGDNAPVFGQQVSTIQGAADLMVDGDVLMLGNQEYDENVTFTGKNNVTVIGTAPRGSTRVTALTNGTAFTINGGQGVQLININAEGRGTGGGVKLDGQIRRFVASLCKFHGGAVAFLISPAAGGQIVDCLLDDCEIALATTGISNVVGGGDPTHRLTVRNSRFYALTTDCVVSAGAAINTQILNNFFTNDGDTEPTRFVKLDGAGDSGLVAGNQFATPTNANTKFVLDADVMWGANATEAGWSSARPA
jgi:hypothetical protein